MDDNLGVAEGSAGTSGRDEPKKFDVIAVGRHGFE